jgi:hypothetical protein
MAFTTIVVGRVGPIRIHSAISLGSRGGLPHEAPLGIIDEVSSYFRWDLPFVWRQGPPKRFRLESQTLLEERP